MATAAWLAAFVKNAPRLDLRAKLAARERAATHAATQAALKALIAQEKRRLAALENLQGRAATKLAAFRDAAAGVAIPAPHSVWVANDYNDGWQLATKAQIEALTTYAHKVAAATSHSSFANVVLGTTRDGYTLTASKSSTHPLSFSVQSPLRGPARPFWVVNNLKADPDAGIHDLLAQLPEQA